MFPESLDMLTSRPKTPTSRLVKSYMKTILSNPESRKIFYFLLLNLCYMLVQMLYGVWTNSLGLISDGACVCLFYIYMESRVIYFFLVFCFSYSYGV
jgi:hypothetical protein